MAVAKPKGHRARPVVYWKHGSLSTLSCRPSAIASLLCRLSWKKQDLKERLCVELARNTATPTLLSLAHLLSKVLGKNVP